MRRRARYAPVRTVAGWLISLPVVVGCSIDTTPPWSDEPTSESSLSSSFDRRFEVASRECSDAQEASSPQCSATDEVCFCSGLFDKLNNKKGSDGNPKGKFIVLSGNAHAAEVKQAGNATAHVVNAMNQCDGHGAFDWQFCTGKERAQQIMNQANKSWGGTPPKWFLLNEISSTFTKDTDNGKKYREWVINLSRALHDDHGREVIVFTWARPPHTLFKWAWTELAKTAHIGVEMYLSGPEIRDKGFSVSWCESEYKDWRQSFLNNGVPSGRVLLTEDFAQSEAGVGWGRAGIPDEQWRQALKARTQAAKQANFAGYVSYGWASNKTTAIETNRLAYESIYAGYRLAGNPASAGAQDSGPEPTPSEACTSGTRQCLGDWTYQQCDNGQWSGPWTCASFAGSVCDASDGFCKPPSCGYLFSGSSLARGQSWKSCDGRFELSLQNDGNLVLYQSGTALWASGTFNTDGALALIQSDGNFVVKDSAFNTLWASNTWGHGGAYLSVQNDGNLVVYGDAENNNSLWASNTGGK